MRAREASACRLGAYRAAHRTSDKQRHVRAKLAVREALVRTRANYISLVRSLLRRDGLRIASGTARALRTRLAALPISGELREEVAPLVVLMAALNEQSKQADAELANSPKPTPSSSG